MQTPHGSTRTSCPDCSDCAVQNRPAEDGPDGSPLVGWASAGLFLAPVLLAILGAACFGGGPEGEFLGAIAGLGVGMAGSAGIARLLNRNGNTVR